MKNKRLKERSKKKKDSKSTLPTCINYLTTDTIKGGVTSNVINFWQPTALIEYKIHMFVTDRGSDASMCYTRTFHVQSLDVSLTNSSRLLDRRGFASFKTLPMNQMSSMLCTNDHHHQYYVHYIYNYSVFLLNSVETRRPTQEQNRGRPRP